MKHIIIITFQLAFRSTFSLVSQKKDHIRRLLLNPAPVSSAHTDLENAVGSFLRKTVDTFDLTHCIEVRYEFFEDLFSNDSFWFKYHQKSQGNKLAGPRTIPQCSLAFYSFCRRKGTAGRTYFWTKDSTIHFLVLTFVAWERPLNRHLFNSSTYLEQAWKIPVL